MLLAKLKVYFGEFGTREGVINHWNDFLGYLIKKFNLTMISFVGKLVFA